MLFMFLSACQSEDVPEPHEPTNKLVVYSNIYNNRILSLAIEIFAEKYPEVEIEHRVFENEQGYREYHEKLRTEIIVGSGPDLIVSKSADFVYSAEGIYKSDDFQDIYKTMGTGVFADLNVYIENDVEFDLTRYNEKVLECGIYNGKRYILPISYILPVMFTAQEILDEENINYDINTYDGFMKAVTSYNDKYGADSDKNVFKAYEYNFPDSTLFFYWSGIDFVDYKSNKVALDNPRLKDVVDLVKRVYGEKYTQNFITIEDFLINLLKEKKLLFFLRPKATILWEFAMDWVNFADFKPVCFNYPNVNNGVTAFVDLFAAIPNSSKNQVNAYNLLKILLSDEVQGFSYDYRVEGNTTYRNTVYTSISVLESVMKTRLYLHEDDPLLVYQKKPSEEFINGYIDVITNVDECKLPMPEPYKEYWKKNMTPYFEGTESYEECLSKLKNDLEWYLSE